MLHLAFHFRYYSSSDGFIHSEAHAIYKAWRHGMHHSVLGGCIGWELKSLLFNLHSNSSRSSTED
jgi:hypothetical protein